MEIKYICTNCKKEIKSNAVAIQRFGKLIPQHFVSDSTGIYCYDCAKKLGKTL